MKVAPFPSTIPASEYEKKAPHELENPLAKKTWGATFIGCLLVGTFLTWFYYVYIGYMRWYQYHKLGDHSVIQDGEAPPTLPETGIVKVGIPLFIGSIFLEWILSLVLGYIENYRLADTMASFSNGLLQQIVDTLTNILGDALGYQLLTAIPYAWIYENYGLTRALEGNLIGFLVMWFGRDLGYYWFHRAAHRSAFMWAIHGVHHSPNEFNYSVNVCQGAIQRISSTVFYAPLALICPPELYLLIFPMEKIYGFMTHTRLVNKMYGISLFFVTPSTHRVHHAGAPSKYIDKNYGEMLTIWDRLFGTHIEEDEPIVFGHVHPLDTWNPMENQLRVWKEIWAKTKKCSSIVDKCLCFVMPPGWNPETRGEYPLSDTTPYSALKYDSQLPWFMCFYTFFWFVLTIGVGVLTVTFPSKIPPTLLYPVFAYIVLSLTAIGSLSDRSRYAVLLELVKLILTPFITYWALITLNIELYGYPLERWVGAMALISISSIFIVLGHTNYFVPETQIQRDQRVWIREHGRKFTRECLKSK